MFYYSFLWWQTIDLLKFRNRTKKFNTHTQLSSKSHPFMFDTESANITRNTTYKKNLMYKDLCFDEELSIFDSQEIRIIVIIKYLY